MIEIELLNGVEDRVKIIGPFDYAQIVYGTVTVGPDGEKEVAFFENGMWIDESGEKYSDLIFRTAGV